MKVSKKRFAGIAGAAAATALILSACGSGGGEIKTSKDKESGDGDAAAAEGCEDFERIRLRDVGALVLLNP